MGRPEIGELALQVMVGIDPMHMLHATDPVEVGVLQAIARRVVRERKAKG